MDKDNEGVDDFWYGQRTYGGIALPRFPRVSASLKDHLTAIRNLDTHSSDILICAFPKSGSNWMHEIIMMLMHGVPEYTNVHKSTRMLEGISTMDEVAALPSPRVINTHVPFHFLPKKHIREGYKIIHVMRNPKDVAVSLYVHTAKDRVMLNEQYPGTWDNFLTLFRDNKIKSNGGWFDYVKQFEEEIDKGNVRNIHTLFYEDMHQNSVTEIKRLAAFLEVDCDDAKAREIQQKCSFDSMFNHHETMEYVQKDKSRSVDGTNVYFRKGVVGDWKNWFTVKQNEMFDAALKRELENSKLFFKYEI